MDEYNEMWMIVGTWWTQADMAESWWRSGGLHAQWDCGPYNDSVKSESTRAALLVTCFVLAVAEGAIGSARAVILGFIYYI